LEERKDVRLVRGLGRCGGCPWLWSLSRLWLAPNSRHSDRTADLPRRKKRCENTGAAAPNRSAHQCCNCGWLSGKPPASPGSVLRVGSENGHLLCRGRAVRRDVISHVSSGAYFREHAAPFPRPLYPTASWTSSIDTVSPGSVEEQHRQGALLVLVQLDSLIGGGRADGQFRINPRSNSGAVAVVPTARRGRASTTSTRDWSCTGPTADSSTGSGRSSSRRRRRSLTPSGSSVTSCRRLAARR
jgi:hypothetical protein